MCALFGWLDYKGIVPNTILKKLTQALANSAEERGTDAAGISYICDGKVDIYKRPKPARKLRFNVPVGTKSVMGHTRLTTQGNQKFNFNNHPFLGHADKDFAFAHNGVLLNDDELRKCKKLPKTQIETDSYVAVQLLESQDKLNFDSLQYMAETVQGNFTFTVLDVENSLYIVKGSNPMCLLHFEELGLYIYASTESIMKNALHKVGLTKIFCEKIEVVEGDILHIDKNGKITRSQFEPKLYRPKYMSWYGDDEPYYDVHEELLLAYCGCYGVDSSDVELLLEYGYTCDEIEDMLADHNLLHETLQAIKFEDDESLYENCCYGEAL